MHLIKLSDVYHSEKKLTQAVLQITQMLGIYHAELARILHLRCSDIGEISNGNASLLKQSCAWSEAEKYIELYECLYKYKDGNEALMNNWLRKENKSFQAVPLYMMVDESRIDEVLSFLKCKGGN